MRFVFFPLIVLTAFIFPWWAFLLCAILYAFFTEGVELLFLGAILDTLFGTSVGWFPGIFYTLSLLGILLVLWAFKPLLSFYKPEW